MSREPNERNAASNVNKKTKDLSLDEVAKITQSGTVRMGVSKVTITYPKCLIAITTFQKSDALRVLLNSLLGHGYLDNNSVVVCDDNAGKGYEVTRGNNPYHPIWFTDDSEEVQMPSAPEVVEEFKAKHPEVDITCIFGKKRGGVSINKNRGIKYFLDHHEFVDILMMDDDIVFHAPGYLDLCRSSRHSHLLAYLGSPDEERGKKLASGETGNPFFSVFPAQGEDEFVYYCTGAQEMCRYATRDAIERVGYFDIFKHHYGFESAVFSSRINMAYGKFLDWFPVLKNSPDYFVSQSIANNYEIKDVYANRDQWMKRKEMVFRGIDLKVKNPGDIE